MKNIISIIFITISLWACTGQDMEMDKAKNTAEKAIGLIGKEDFENLSDLYSNDFSTSEPKEVRLQKFKQIIDAIGTVKNYELSDSNSVSEIGEESRITLTYKVTHSKLNTLETYIIGKESGNYVISGINIHMTK